MQPVPHEDAVRIAERLWEQFSAQADGGWSGPWSDVPKGIQAYYVAVVEELLRAEVIFPGPSLYAEDTA
jgi:hypothetical protein